MLLLLSPAKSQNFDTPAPITGTQPLLKKEITLLAQELKHYSTGQLAELMNLSDKLAVLNHQRYQQFSDHFNEDNAKPCAFAFQGDAYKGLDIDTLNREQWQFLQQHLIILSGLYGLLRPLDLIQPYRLEMKTALRNNQGKDLYQFWGDTLAKQINHIETDIIVNLASNEYFKAVSTPTLKADVITCQFKERKNGDYKMIGIYAKRARGLMTRFIAQKQLTNIDDIKNFDLENYAFNNKLSSEKTWVFTRG